MMIRRGRAQLDLRMVFLAVCSKTRRQQHFTTDSTFDQRKGGRVLPKQFSAKRQRVITRVVSKRRSSMLRGVSFETASRNFDLAQSCVVFVSKARVITFLSSELYRAGVVKTLNRFRNSSIPVCPCSLLESVYLHHKRADLDPFGEIRFLSKTYFLQQN